MEKQIKYKLQGDGKDSWEIKEFNDEGELVNAYMVYEDPESKPVPNVDVVGLLNTLTEEEINQIKQILNIN